MQFRDNKFHIQLGGIVGSSALRFLMDRQTDDIIETYKPAKPKVRFTAVTRPTDAQKMRAKAFTGTHSIISTLSYTA